VTATDDVVERPAVGREYGGQRPVRRVPKPDQERHVVWMIIRADSVEPSANQWRSRRSRGTPHQWRVIQAQAKRRPTQVREHQFEDRTVARNPCHIKGAATELTDESEVMPACP
jgi:hypothetical protein